MKTTTTVLMMTFVLCAALQAMAAEQSTETSASLNIQKKGLQVANPFAGTPVGEKNKSQIERVGGMSSQPWTQIVGWHAGEPSSFMDAKRHEPKLHLLWIGSEPQP